MAERPTGWQALERSYVPEDWNEELSELAKAYTHALGNGNTGAKVMADLVQKFYSDSVFRFDGPFCGERAAFLDGQRSVIMHICRMLA